MTELRLTVRPPRPGVWEHTGLEIAIGQGWDSPMPRWSGVLRGVETDYLDTITSAAVMSWAYEAEIRDVVRAVASVKNLAVKHRTSSEF